MINTSENMFIHPITRQMVHPGDYYETPAHMDHENETNEVVQEEVKIEEIKQEEVKTEEDKTDIKKGKNK